MTTKKCALPTIPPDKASREMRVLMTLMLLKEPSLSNIQQALGLSRRTVVHYINHLRRDPPGGFGMEIVGRPGKIAKGDTAGYEIAQYGVFNESELKRWAKTAEREWRSHLTEHGLSIKALD